MCKYCEGEVDERECLIDTGMGIDIRVDLYLDGNNNLSADIEGGQYESKINYCPMCGRKL